MTLTPKKDFLDKKQFADIHRDIVVSSHFREALHAALLEQILAMPHGLSTEAAAAAHHEIMGARQFIDRLINIAEQPKTPPTKPPANLDHTIR